MAGMFGAKGLEKNTTSIGIKGDRLRKDQLNDIETVSSFSNSPLDAGLFDVPEGYKLKQQGLRSSALQIAESHSVVPTDQFRKVF